MSESKPHQQQWPWRRQMNAWLLAGLGLASSALTISTLPAQAQNAALETASKTAQSITLFNLDKAICANNWDGAITLVGALVAQDETTHAQRANMLELRRQLERYRTENAIVIDSLACDRTDPYILESAISTDSIFTGSTSTDSERVRPLGWEAAVAEATNNQYSTELITESVDFSLPVNTDTVPGLTTAEPVDLNNGLNVVSGHVGSGHEVYSFVARLGDRIDIHLDVTQVMTGSLYTSDDSQLFVFDRQGNLIASADDRSDSAQSTINAMVAPRTDLYFAVVTSYNNDPILNRAGQLTGWQNNGGGRFDYTLTISGVTPTRAMLR